jgi:hypothetical protein
MTMADLTRDPIVNVVYNGIKRPIGLLLDSECFPAAVTLIYSGMDAMAFLSMPSKQNDVTGGDFIQWTERYIHFPCKEQLSGLDLYGARCSVLHAHGIKSRLSRQGKCRMVGYADYMVPEVYYRPKVSTELVMVSIRGLAEAFFSGVDAFLIDLFSDSVKAALAEERLTWMHHTFPYQPGPPINPQRT